MIPVFVHVDPNSSEHVLHRLDSLVLHFGRRWPSRSRFKHMDVPFRSMNRPIFLLTTHFCSEDPLVLENLFHAGAFCRVNFEHATDNVSAFSREYPEQSPGAFDHLLLFTT